jgi:malate dehydrogenase (quinone)
VKLDGNVEASDEELHYTSRVLGLKCDESPLADATPPVRKPSHVVPAENEPAADIAL